MFYLQSLTVKRQQNFGILELCLYMNNKNYKYQHLKL